MAGTGPPVPRSTSRAAIENALTLLKALDNAQPDQTTALFYAHGYWELWMALREVLRSIGEDPGD